MKEYAVTLRSGERETALAYWFRLDLLPFNRCDKLS